MKNKLRNQKKIQRINEYIIKNGASGRMHLGDSGVGEERHYAEEILRENIKNGKKGIYAILLGVLNVFSFGIFSRNVLI